MLGVQSLLMPHTMHSTQQVPTGLGRGAATEGRMPKGPGCIWGPIIPNMGPGVKKPCCIPMGGIPIIPAGPLKPCGRKPGTRSTVSGHL